MLAAHQCDVTVVEQLYLACGVYHSPHIRGQVWEAVVLLYIVTNNYPANSTNSTCTFLSLQPQEPQMMIMLAQDLSLHVAV